MGLALAVAGVALAVYWTPGAEAKLLGTAGVLDYRQDSEPLNFAFPGDPTFGLPASVYRLVNLNCPVGTVATGGGASIPGAGGSTYLGRTVGETSWSAQAWQLATEPERNLVGYAICSELSKNRTELYRLRADRPLGASFVSLTCPGRKWHVTGGGVGPNDNRPEQGFIHSTFPIDGSDKGRVPDDGWKVVTSSDNVVPKKFTAYAICAGRQGKP